MQQVACVFVGKKYSPEYVHRLHAGVARQMPETGWVFNVVTDQPKLFPEYSVIDVKHLKIPGYWNKLCLFMKDAFPEGSRVLYLDLDTLVIGPLSGLLQEEGDFWIMEDAIHPHRLNSSAMMWTAGSKESRCIYDRWVKEGRPFGARLSDTKGDQAWIEWALKQEAVEYRTWAPWQVIGYYRPGVPPGPWLKLGSLPNSRVIVFHGKPRFSDPEMPQWVKELWRAN